MYIDWTPDYAIGVARIDEQHQQLIAMINALYEKIGPDVSPSATWALLDGFNRYAESHFATEERIALEGRVPTAELNAHKQEHQAYRDRMGIFQHAFAQNEKRAPVQLMAFLSSWWLSHILVRDKELGRLINERQAHG